MTASAPMPLDTAEASASQTMPIGRPGRATKIAQHLGLLDHSNMFWSWSADDTRNFGDWVGPLLFAWRTGRTPLYYRPKPHRRGRAYMTAGSIMRHIKCPDRAIVWGSGLMNRHDVFARPRNILAVRGPLTRQRCLELGYDCPEVYGDPAILLPEVIRATADRPIHGLGIIPHYVNHDEAMQRYSGIPGVRLIDVRRPISEIVADIVSCRVTVSSSLHGLIVSHAYARPSAWVRFTGLLDGDGTKFGDYYQSVGVFEELHPLEVGERTSVQDLLDLVDDAPFPSQERLRARLLAACPF